MNPPKKQPERSDFGIPENESLVTNEQKRIYNKISRQEENPDFPSLPQLFGDNVLAALERERAFYNANRYWGQYQNWKANRNPARAILEEKFGHDTKHSSHLVRLISEGKELLLTGNITFPRPDAEELLAIKRGKYSYDELMGQVGDLDAQFDTWYEKSSLPHSPNKKKVDELCIDIVQAKLDCDVLEKDI